MGERWGKMGKKWVKNEITGVQKTALMHASAHLADADGNPWVPASDDDDSTPILPLGDPRRLLKRCTPSTLLCRQLVAVS